MGVHPMDDADLFTLHRDDMTDVRELDESSFSGPFRTLARKINELIRQQKADRLLSGVGYTLSRNTGGTSLNIKSQTVTTGSSEPLRTV